MEKTFLNVISAYALNILRKNLAESGYIEPKEISSVTPKSKFGKDIKISDFLDNYEIVYFMEKNFSITLPDNTELTTVGALCDQTAKAFYTKNQAKLNAIAKHIAQDIVNMTYNTPAIHNSIPELNIARKQTVSDVLSKSTPDYDFDLLLKSIKSKYNVDIDRLYKNITTIDSLIAFVALEIEKTNRFKKPVKQSEYTVNNAYDNSRQQIMTKLESDLQTRSLVDTDKKHPLSLSTQLQFNNYYDYVSLYNIAASKYNVEINKSELFKMKTVHDYCDAIMKKRIAMFQQTKASKVM
jgi:acyl carrier protein